MDMFPRLYRFTALAVFAVALTRLLPHWPNATPILAIGLVSGSVFALRSWSFLVPILAMVISDLALGAVLGWEYALHGSQWAVYACVAGTVFLGRFLAPASAYSRVFAGGTIASVVFFLVTNFATWYGSTMYTHDLAGLATAYVAGLAFVENGGNFFLNGLLSTWAYSAALFALVEFARPRLSNVTTVSAR